jgi:hypothetical protein
MIVITSGLGVGSTAWITKDLGANIAQVTDLYTTIGTAFTSALLPGASFPVTGDTFNIVTPSTFDAGFTSLGAVNTRFRFVAVDLTPALAAGNEFSPRDSSFTMNLCKIERTPFTAATGGVLTVATSLFTFAALTALPINNPQAFQACGFINADVQIGHRGDLFRTLFIDCHVESGLIRTILTVNFASNGANFIPAFLNGGEFMVAGTKGLGVFDSPSSGIQISAKGLVITSSPLYGKGNTTAGVNISEGSTLQVKSTTTPTITGAVQDLIIDAGAVIPSVAGGTGLPVAGAAITSWATWAGAPYSRNANNLVNNTAIINFA